MSYYHLELEQYSDWVCTIHTPNSIGGTGSSGGKISQISGVMINPLHMNMSATTDKIGIIKALETMASSATDFMLGETIGGVVKAGVEALSFSVLTTSLQWKGNAEPFTFGCEFVVFETGVNGVGQCDNYNTLVTALARMTQPKQEARKQIFAMQEPTYYNVIEYWKAFLATVGGNEKSMQYFEANLFKVSIGKHFLASYLIPVKSDIAFSSSLNENGRPLYATVNLGFTTYRALTFDEYASMFRR